MTKERRERLDRKLWKKKFPGGIPPFPTPFSPETDAYWREWFEAREARLALEKQAEAEGSQSDFNEPEDASSSVSTRPAAIPKAAGRCREGDFCPDLMNCSCIYDTSSSVTMDSVKSVQSRSLSREGEERPGTPDPRYDPSYDFTINDLDLQVGILEDQDKPPSIIWTEASVQSTLPSVIETDPSIVSTQPSVISTVPSVLILDEVDWRYQCQCGARMGLTERVATWDFSARYPAPFICHNCRWATVGL